MRRIAALAILSIAVGCGAPDVDPRATVDVRSPLGKKYLKLGGSTALGSPVTAAFAALGGEAQVQRFTGGVIVYSDDFGAVYLTDRIYDHWISLGGVPYGSGTLQDFIGPPRQDAADRGGYESAFFKRGEIFDIAGSLYTVYGRIYERYDTVRGSLGLPAGDASSIGNGGLAQAFAGGVMYWKEETGAHYVNGATAARWWALGGATGPLGFPTADTSAVLRPDGTASGTSARFENGVIYAGPAGAFEVTGRLLTAYEQAYGGPNSPLGYPTSAAVVVAGGRQQSFQHGMLVLPPGAARPVAYGTLDVYVDSIWGTGDDCIGGICGNQDVYAYLKIWVNGTLKVDQRIPGSGDCSGDCQFQATYILDAVAGSSTVIDVKIEGWDADAWPNGDDHLGTVSTQYTSADNWGDGQSDRHDNGDFHAKYLVKPGPRPFDRNDFRGNMWWSFDNWSTPSLSYGQFGRTFADVGPDEKWWLHPFHRLFYLLYEGMANGGNCFGMSLESIYAQAGRSPYAEPIWDYFPDTADGRDLDQSNDPRAPGLIDQINLKQGYQLGADMMLYTLGMFAVGLTHDPMVNYAMSGAAHAAGDAPLLCVFDSYLFGNGHTIRPYEWNGSLFDPVDCPDTGQIDACWTIQIADPNHPTENRPPNTRVQTVMSIHLDDNSYEYRDGYSGGSFAGGRMFWVPGWLLNDQPVTPLASIFQLVNDGFITFLNDSGDTHQISNAGGRRLFKEGLSGPPTRWEDMEMDSSQRLTDVAPIGRSDGPGGQPVEMFFGAGAGVSHRHEIAPKNGVPNGTPYNWIFASGALSSSLEVPGTNGRPDVLAVSDIGASGKRVTFELPSGSVPKAITWIIAGPDRDRWAELHGMNVAEGQRISAWVTNNGQALHFDNTGPETTAVLYVKAEPDQQPVHVGQITIGGGVTAPVDFDTPDTTLAFVAPTWGNDGWLKAAVTVTLSVQDYGRGIARTEYTNAPPAWHTYTAPFLYSDEGRTTLWYRSLDSKGNLESEKDQEVKIDTRVPAVLAWTDTATYDRVTPFIVHFTADDPAPGSGIKWTMATLDSTVVSSGETVDLLWYPLGTHTLTVMAEDVAGWVSTSTTSFTIAASSQSIIELIRELVLRQEIGANIARSLIAKMEAAQAAEARGQKKTAVNTLSAALHELRSGIVGRHVTQRAADLLIGDIQFQIDALQ